MIKTAKIKLRPDYVYKYTFQKQSLQKTSVHVILGTSINHGVMEWGSGWGLPNLHSATILHKNGPHRGPGAWRGVKNIQKSVHVVYE